MGNQGGSPVEIDNLVVAEKTDAGFQSKSLSKQKIPITVLEVYLSTGIGKPPERRLYLPVRRVVVVISEVGVEKIPQDVQPLGTAYAAVQETQETLRNCRPCNAEMQIGDKQRFVFQGRGGFDSTID